MNNTEASDSFASVCGPPRPIVPLLDGISDYHLSLVVPIIVHWLTAGIYEAFRQFGIFKRYEIHTFDEEQVWNKVNRAECLRGVIGIQAMQTLVGLLLGAITSEENLDHSCVELSLWERRIQSVLLLSMSAIATKSLSPTYAVVAWPSADLTLSLEYYTYIGQAARIFYHWIMPLLRFYIALWLADTWVFFVHRAEHSNRWLYKTFHARHHELFIPYSWGGIYDHPIESLFLSVGAFAIAIGGTGMSLRESMIFSAFSSAKACTDHSGYAIPWNPIDFFTTIGAQYHDKHHQRWGIKNNFALHFQFWDRLMGTDMRDDEAVEILYIRNKESAKAAMLKRQT
ncbi:uncharacterized protein RHO25_000008 [Cercospora beticola]|uniref:Fatty acid hydroxylase domain-containing protein n=2 Tax=Cercospora beticola TaxID=122368 RepID=A0ABZ0N6C9_CERBT|nr:hypothetical protein RHO25_000008 [Cercospora beticola]